MNDSIKDKLIRLAHEYENAAFLEGDPSWFMHQVQSDADREAMAFLAQSVSYGSRAQFLPRIQWMLDRSQGHPDAWVRGGGFEADLRGEGRECFYRLYTCATVRDFLRSYRQLMNEHGSLKQYVGARADKDAGKAIGAICDWFASHGSHGVIPADTTSACKRVCMFLRWMVRSGSTVDLGLWADIIDRRSLIMPLDTHVLQQAVGLCLLSSRTASMSAAIRLTRALAQIFPDDPLKGDFALFGYGVSAEPAGRPRLIAEQ